VKDWIQLAGRFYNANKLPVAIIYREPLNYRNGYRLLKMDSNPCSQQCQICAQKGDDCDGDNLELREG
jgi:hypothetical protein